MILSCRYLLYVGESESSKVQYIPITLGCVKIDLFFLSTHEVSQSINQSVT